MKCTFVATGATSANGKYFEHRCPACGRNMWSRLADPASSRRQCTSSDEARLAKPPVEIRDNCRHRGDELHRQECETCSGRQKIKVFACALHTECTLGKKLDGIACCAAGHCQDFSAR